MKFDKRKFRLLSGKKRIEYFENIVNNTDRKVLNKILNSIFVKIKFEESFISKFREHYSLHLWNLISINQKLSDEFIIENIDNINIIPIMYTQRITKQMYRLKYREFKGTNLEGEWKGIKDIDEEFMDKYLNKDNEYLLLEIKSEKMLEKILEKNPRFSTYVFEKMNLSKEFVENNIKFLENENTQIGLSKKVLSEKNYKLNILRFLNKTQKMNSKIINKYIIDNEEIYLEIFEMQDLTEEFLLEHKNKWVSNNNILENMIMFQDISEEFMEKHIDESKYEIINKYRILSNEFIKKYSLKENRSLINYKDESLGNNFDEFLENIEDISKDDLDFSILTKRFSDKQLRKIFHKLVNNNNKDMSNVNVDKKGYFETLLRIFETINLNLLSDNLVDESEEYKKEMLKIKGEEFLKIKPYFSYKEVIKILEKQEFGEDLTNLFIDSFQDNFSSDYKKSILNSSNVSDEFLLSLNGEEVSIAIEKQTIDEEILKKMIKKSGYYMSRQFSFLCRNQKLSEEFIINHINKFDMYDVIKRQDVSEKFMERYKWKLNWDLVSSKNNLSEEFIKKYLDSMNLQILLENNNESDFLSNELINEIFGIDNKLSKFIEKTKKTKKIIKYEKNKSEESDIIRDYLEGKLIQIENEKPKENVEEKDIKNFLENYNLTKKNFEYFTFLLKNRIRLDRKTFKLVQNEYKSKWEEDGIFEKKLKIKITRMKLQIKEDKSDGIVESESKDLVIEYYGLKVNGERRFFFGKLMKKVNLYTIKSSEDILKLEVIEKILNMENIANDYKTTDVSKVKKSIDEINNVNLMKKILLNIPLISKYQKTKIYKENLSILNDENIELI